MANPPRNLAASVQQRLKNAARGRGEDYQFVLTQYGLERLLYRLVQTGHGSSFVLKGALLFQLWTNETHRATRDMDLLGHGVPSAERLEAVFREVCTAAVEEDGLTLLAQSVRAQAIKEEDEYQGLRVRIEARLGNVRIPLQVDVGFGDAITPGPVEVVYPTLLDFPAPTIRAYPRETVIAEKFQAMVDLGMANSRMKDFFDLWTLARRFEFEGSVLCESLRATFSRRKTALPSSPPLAFSDEFVADAAKQTQWSAFLRKGNLDAGGARLADVVSVLRAFLMPPVDALQAGTSFSKRWQPDAGWQPTAAD